MMTMLRTTLLALAAVFLAAAPTLAQTTLTSTTLAAAVIATGQAGDTSSASQIEVASASGIEVGDLVAILRGNRVAEFARVRAISGAFLTVSRGVDSRPVGHLRGETLYHAPEEQFYRGLDPVGRCTRATERYLPHISRTTGNVSDCSSAGEWYRLDLPNDGSRNLITKRGTATLDGANPTPVTTGLVGIVSCILTSNRSAAPGLDPTAFTATWVQGGTLNIYAWKPTAAGDATLIASTDSDDVVAWACEGT